MSQDDEERTVRCGNPSCGKVIYPGRSRRRKYCSEACKQAAYRLRRKRQAAALR